MPIYDVNASETIYESCRVEANSPEEAMEKVRNGDEFYVWITYDGDDFEVSDVVLSEDQSTPVEMQE